MPGVSSTGDIAAGYNVRGGENSQNLILQDGAIIFNPTHLFGFFSAFNPDFIESVTLLKGGGQASYGGRVSSVLDIQTKNGDLDRFKVNGGIGVISSRLTFSGPIKKKKSSFILGGRLSYSSWFLHYFDDINLKNSFANFHDISAKYFQVLDEKNYLSATAYSSYDDFNLGIDSTYNWSTKNLSIRWNHIYSSQHRSNLIYASSNYTSKLISNDQLYGYDYKNRVNVNSLLYKHDITLSKKTNLITGLSLNHNIISPGTSLPNKELSIYDEKVLEKQYSLEPSIFIDSEIELTNKWGLNLGVRYNHFLRLGKGNIYQIDRTQLNDRLPLITNSNYYGDTEIINQYNGLEPRTSLRYVLNKSSSIKAGYYKTTQFLHQISTTNSPSPIDYWVTSSPNIKPQRSHQLSLGYFKNFNDNIYESFVEGFYKKVINTIDYIAGVDFQLNPEYEAALLQGKGYAYGLEFMIKKNKGDFNGWISYTYSRSTRKFQNETLPQLAINNGQIYNSVFDQPHQLSVVTNIKLSELATLSTNFVYNSGRPLTIPVSKYAYDNVLAVNNYSERNAYRGPDYHRLDLSLTVKNKYDPKKIFKGEMVFSIFNLYARKNAYAIFFNNYGTAYKTSILGSIVPSISYNFTIN